MDIEILKIASDTANHKILKSFTHAAKLKSKFCGDEIKISLQVKNNKISDFAYEGKCCVFCQASASALSKVSINKNIDVIKKLTKFFNSFFDVSPNKIPKEYKMFEKLFKKQNLPRKDCLLLPFKTLIKALKS